MVVPQCFGPLPHAPSCIAGVSGPGFMSFASACVGYSSAPDAIRARRTVVKEEKRAKSSGKGKKKTEYAQTFAHQVNSWRKMHGGSRISHVDTATHWDVPPGAIDGSCNPSGPVVGRWWRDQESVQRKAGEETRLHLAGAYGRCVSRRSQELLIFEKLLAKSLDRRRRQGKNVNPWIVGRLLQLPKWKSQTEGLKWNGTEILFRVRYLRSFLHRYDFSPVKPSNIRPKDLQMVGHDMCNWSGMMRE